MKLLHIVTLFVFISTQFKAFSHSFEVPRFEATSPNCTVDCVVPFGDFIGSSREVKAYSNCNSSCIYKNATEGITFLAKDTGLSSDVWIGIPWQCVEYARRWVLQNQNIVIHSVDSAFEIWNQNETKDLLNNKNLYFDNFVNGNSTPPAEGDILIYGKSSELHYGHVAIIVNVDLENLFVDIAEENYQNKKWENTNLYSRRVILNHENNTYYITDLSYETKEKYFKNDDVNIIGWKRLIKNI
ncbi:CHAP domain-containing protein [Fluviispira vulneris]|uniref:CHAP domain-containing protein n=1 Tax=Fluviispira vulneris TaxID=2763012 RepID=UPI001644C242|nr:CHAP domain-containing protein [Fluviispira vulneris]